MLRNSVLHCLTVIVNCHSSGKEARYFFIDYLCYTQTITIMNEDEKVALLTTAIIMHKKIELQMQDAPEDQHHLFHPYCIVRDYVTEALEIFGWIERSYVEHDAPFHRIGILSGVKNMVLLEDTFEPIADWRIDLRRYVPVKIEVLPIN